MGDASVQSDQGVLQPTGKVACPCQPLVGKASPIALSEVVCCWPIKWLPGFFYGQPYLAMAERSEPRHELLHCFHLAWVENMTRAWKIPKWWQAVLKYKGPMGLTKCRLFLSDLSTIEHRYYAWTRISGPHTSWGPSRRMCYNHCLPSRPSCHSTFFHPGSNAQYFMGWWLVYPLFPSKLLEWIFLPLAKSIVLWSFSLSEILLEWLSVSYYIQTVWIFIVNTMQRFKMGLDNIQICFPLSNWLCF